MFACFISFLVTRNVPGMCSNSILIHPYAEELVKFVSLRFSESWVKRRQLLLTRCWKNGQRLYASQLERFSVSGSYINLREVTLRVRAVPGDYLVIPSCYDADITGEFLLRFYTEVPLNQNSVKILDYHKDNLSDTDMFFKTKSIDDAFASWNNLLGNSTRKVKMSNDDFEKSSLTDYKSTTSLSSIGALNKTNLNASFAKLHDFKEDDIFKKIERKTNKPTNKTILGLF